MSFAPIKRFFQRLSVRLAVIFSLLFLISASVSFGVLYFLLSEHLKKNDQSIIEAKWREYEEVYRVNGIAGMTAALTTDRMKEGDVPLLVEVLGQDGKPIFLKIPQDGASPKVVKDQLSRLPKDKGWYEITTSHEEDKILIFSQAPESLPVLLRVGKSSDPRDDLLENLTQLFAVISGVFILLGAATGIFFSNRALAPLRNLVSAMREVRRGSLSARMPLPPTGDEMEELGTIFNQMLDRIETLVVGMRETLDNVAHDIRTPITRIRAVAEFTLRSAPSDKDRAALEECAENADDINSILTSLFDLAEAEAGAMPLKRSLVTVSSLVRPVIDLYEVIADEKSMKVSFEGDTEARVLVDPPKIRQALSNLLDNAIKYSPPHKKITFRASDEPSAVVISVQDQGDGIGAYDLPRIWDRLFRADRSRSKSGFGIGLSLVKAIVLAHGGTASVESAPGQGSVFSLSFPKLPAAKSPGA